MNLRMMIVGLVHKRTNEGSGVEDGVWGMEWDREFSMGCKVEITGGRRQAMSFFVHLRQRYGNSGRHNERGEKGGSM